jgi:hypothetical protein
MGSQKCRIVGKSSVSSYDDQSHYLHPYDASLPPSRPPSDTIMRRHGVEQVLVGVANVYLSSLSYMIDFEDAVDVCDYTGKVEGVLQVRVQPCRPLQ